MAEPMRVNLLFLLGMTAVQADVRVFVEESRGCASINYECTAGEVVQAFALDATVDRGVIVGISDFFRGESRIGARGYGVFPASFREYLAVSSDNTVDWTSNDYSPQADPADYPEDTLPGLGSHGVTLELGGLWDPSVPEAIPAPAGTLCVLHLSEAAQVSLSANAGRGGLVATSADLPLMPIFTGAYVDPSVQIRRVALAGETLTIDFQGGELEHATSLEGPWTASGNRTGLFRESIQTSPARFYRVRRP